VRIDDTILKSVAFLGYWRYPLPGETHSRLMTCRLDGAPFSRTSSTLTFATRGENWRKTESVVRNCRTRPLRQIGLHLLSS